MSNFEDMEPREARGKAMRVTCPCGTVYESIDITAAELEGLNFRRVGEVWLCHQCAGLPEPVPFREAWGGPDGKKHIGGEPPGPPESIKEISEAAGTPKDQGDPWAGPKGPEDDPADDFPGQKPVFP